MRPAVLLLLLLPLLVLPPLAKPDTPRVAIIMDDVGYNLELGRRALDLPGEVTIAVIPLTPHGQRLAGKSAERDLEVIIHLPMTGGFTEPLLDPGGIHDEMSPTEIAAVIRDAFERIPQARGLNNHMGSRFTANPEAMHWVMHELAAQDAFFVDSLTTPESVGRQMAHHHGLAATARDVFLDNERGKLDINEQFNKLIGIARRRGYAVAIGHPYPETLDYLEEALPLLEESGIELVPVSELLSSPPSLPPKP